MSVLLVQELGARSCFFCVRVRMRGRVGASRSFARRCIHYLLVQSAMLPSPLPSRIRIHRNSHVHAFVHLVTFVEDLKTKQNKTSTLCRHSRLRAKGSGCSVILLGENQYEITAKATISSKVPGARRCQTVPRAEMYALFLMVQAWGGTYSLDIVTHVSYTVYGMMGGNRRKHLRRKNGDLWRLIHQELDTKDRNPLLIKVKSHINGKQVYHRQTPYWQIGLNELADASANYFSDHQGECVTEINAAKASEALLGQVCRRIAVMESSLRGFAIDPPLVAADITNACEIEGERRRQQITAKASAEIHRQDPVLGHNRRCDAVARCHNRTRNAGNGKNA